jgi:hypothetical protein
MEIPKFSRRCNECTGENLDTYPEGYRDVNLPVRELDNNGLYVSLRYRPILSEIICSSLCGLFD